MRLLDSYSPPEQVDRGFRHLGHFLSAGSILFELALLKSQKNVLIMLQTLLCTLSTQKGPTALVSEDLIHFY